MRGGLFFSWGGGGGSYCYFGIQKGIERILLQNRYEYSNILKLVFNIDGLTLFESAGI